MLSPVPSQELSGNLRGVVTLDDGDPAIGATILINRTPLGTSARADGTFLIQRIPEGIYYLTIRLVGYQTVDSLKAIIRPGETTSLSIQLRQSAVKLKQVDITTSRHQEAKDVRMSVRSMTPRETKYLPGAAEDVLRSLRSMPGVLSLSDYSSQLVIRGSGPDQNLILIDGHEVINPYRLYGFISMFNPETVSDITLQTGGFAAQYGDRLSAVLDVRNREGRSDALIHGKINSSLTNANLVLEGGLPLNTSYIFSARRTYYDLILGPILRSSKLVEGDVALPNFRDFQLKLASTLNSTNKLVFDAITSRDGVQFVSGTERDRPDSVNLIDESHNSLLGATWQLTPTRNLLFETQVSWYRNNGTGLFDASIVDPSQNSGDLGRSDTIGLRFFNFGVTYDYVFQKTSLAERMLLNLGAHSLEAGIGYDALRTDYIRYFELDRGFRDYIIARGGIVPTDITQTIHYHRANAYVQDRMALTERLYIQPGVRFDFYPFLSQDAHISPRVNGSYKLDDLSTIRASYGIFYQSPGLDKQQNTFRYNYSNATFKNLQAERAEHYVLSYDRMVTPEWQFKVDSYYKRFSDLIAPQKLPGSAWVSERTSGNIFTAEGWTVPKRVSIDSLTPIPVNGAIGSAYGIEFLMQKIQVLPSDRFTGWISYALSFANRNRDSIETPFLFDQRHAVNIVGNYKFAARWDVGVNFILRSGRPYNVAKGIKPRIALQDIDGIQTPVFQRDGKGKVILDIDYEQERYSGRLNLYHSLDLRITTYPQWWDLNWSLYLDITNIYNHKNEEQKSYYIDANGSLRERVFNGLPIFPALGLTIVF